MVNKNAQLLGKLGGQATAEKHGSKHFSEAGKKGMIKRWNLVPCTNCGELARDRNGDGLAYCSDCQENNEMGETYGN